MMGLGWVREMMEDGVGLAFVWFVVLVCFVLVFWTVFFEEFKKKREIVGA